MTTSKPERAAAVASAGPFLVLFAFTVPLTTLTSTAHELGSGAGSQAWIMSAMSVGAAAGLLGSGTMGDRFGRRRMFVFGALMLACASLLAAFAPNSSTFVLARVLQGVGGSAILACSLGLIAQLYPSGSKRIRATGVWAAALGAGVAIGPIVSAGLDHFGGWRLPHGMTALGAALLAVAGRAMLSESRADDARPIDLVGMLLLGSSVAILLAGLTEIRAGLNQKVGALLLAALVLIGGFVFAERRVRAPLIDITLFRRADFVAATLAAIAAGAGVLSIVSFVPTLFERTGGVETIVGATWLLAWSATSVATAYGARWIPVTVTQRSRLIASLVGAAIGQLALFAPDESMLRLVIGLLIAGAANGVLNAALGHEAIATVPGNRAAMGSGANNTARYIGSGVGLTIVTVLVANTANAGSAGALSGWNVAVLVTTGISLCGAAAVLLAPSLTRGSSRSVCERKIEVGRSN